jgi:hypothetical protein
MDKTNLPIGGIIVFQSPCGEFNVGKVYAPVVYDVQYVYQFQSPCGEFNVGKSGVAAKFTGMNRFQSPCGEFNVGKPG